MTILYDTDVGARGDGRRAAFPTAALGAVLHDRHRRDRPGRRAGPRARHPACSTPRSWAPRRPPSRAPSSSWRRAATHAVAAARPVTDAIGSQAWCAPATSPATASRLKLVCNAWVASITAALGQSIALADGLGLDPQLFLDAVDGGAVDAPYVHLKGAAMVGSDWTTSFAVDGVVKDVGLIRAAALESGHRRSPARRGARALRAGERRAATAAATWQRCARPSRGLVDDVDVHVVAVLEDLPGRRVRTTARGSRSTRRPSASRRARSGRRRSAC